MVLLLSAYLAFQTSVVQTYLVRRIADRLSDKLHTHITLKSVDIRFFNKVILNEFLIEDQQGDTLFYVDRMVASINQFKYKKRIINLASLELIKTNLFVSVAEDQVSNYKFLLDALRSVQPTSNSWNFECQNFLFSDTRLGYSYYNMETPKSIGLHNVQVDVTGFVLNRDSMAFQINNLSLDDDKSFLLSSLSTRFVSAGSITTLKDLKVLTPHSVIADADISFDQSEMHEEKDFSLLKLDIDLKQSVLDLTDVAQFVPAIKGMDLQMNISGHVYGTIADLKGKNIEVRIGDNTQLGFDFYANGLPNLDQTYVLLDLKKSTADFNDLSQIRLPNSAKFDYVSFSPLLHDAGIITYEGNFTGFLSDFVAYGTVRSNFGQIKMDLSFLPSESDLLKVNGHLKTVNFKLGKFTQSKRFGELTFNGQVNGSYNRVMRAFDVALDGIVDSLMFNAYKFKNLSLDGTIQDEKFEGDFTIKDPNLDANFAGKLDFNAPIPEFDFEMVLDKANLKALNLDNKHDESMLSMNLKANFKGNSIDNLDGNIWIDEGHYLNENDSITLNGLSVRTFKEEQPHLQIRSDFADIDIEGNYSFRTISKSVKNLLAQYLPSAGLKVEEDLHFNQFDFDVTIKNTEPLTKTFIPSLYVGPSEIRGRFDDLKMSLDFVADIPRIEYRNFILNNYTLSVHSGEKLELKNRLEELQLNENKRIYNLAILADASDDRLNSKLVWNNFHLKTYSGELETQVDFTKTDYNKTHVEIEVNPSKIYIADTLWQVHPAAITIDSTRISVDGFEISNQSQRLSVSGIISEDKDARLNLKLNQLNLSNVNFLTTKDVELKGIINGSASVFDIYERALFLSDLRISNLSYRQHDIGNVSMESKWDRNSEEINSTLTIDTKSHQSFYASGSYTPRTDSLDFIASLNDLSLAILQPVLRNTFENIQGRGTGDVRIHGTPAKLLMDGDVLGLDAGLSINATQVYYYFSDTVRFRSDSIVFDHIEMMDYQGNKGLFNGSIRHDNFKNMDYDLSLSSPRILAMNTTLKDNERFYGKAFARGTLQITGHGTDVSLSATARSLSGTALNISLDYDQKAQEYDFIRFVDKNSNENQTTERRVKQDKSSLNMNFDIDVTPEAQMQLIYNSQIGDVIRSRGSGDLQIRIDPDFNIIMYGEYRVEQGDYLFTLQNVINKKFEIARGGSIIWNGDPYNATIDIDAIYRLKASLTELFPNSVEDIDYSQRIPVSCEIFLTENLNNPEIAFDIKFPTAEDRIKDQVQQFFSTEEEMNKQILSLLVLGRFYTPDYLRGSYQASNTNVVGSTASELFSNQLSNWLSQISNDWDIGVNYRPGNQITNDEIELALSTQIFNDRVTINGNIGNNTSTTNRSNSNNIVGDFDLNVKLTNNGKLQLKAYNRSNDNLIYETSPYTQGIGISYRENYNNLNELWQKFKKLLRKKEKK